MDEQSTGYGSGEAAPEESSLAERLIREEFGEPPAVSDATAPVPHAPPVAPGGDSASYHEEFAVPVRPSASRSHRTGMLAGLGVVGSLLAVLVLLSPGSGQPRLPVQSVHDVSPFAGSGPKTAAATAPPTVVPSTTSSTPSTSTPTTQPHKSETVPTTVTSVYPPETTSQGQTQTQTPTPTTNVPAPTPTTAPPPPPTTTTTSPPTTTTTAKHCILGLIC